MRSEGRRVVVGAMAAGAAAALALLAWSGASRADGAAQPLPFSQGWSNAALVQANDDWSGVPGITGFLGDGLTAGTGTDPQTILEEGSGTADAIANQSSPNTLSSGGVAEFDGLADRVVALQGSGTADAPFLLLSLDTTGRTGIQVSYTLRDLDGSADNAVQQVAVQFRVGAAGSFTNLPAGYVADATSGPGLATLVTPVSVALPPAADDQPLVQVRILTTNAVGNDEWVGIDDIAVTGGSAGPTPPSGAGSATPAVVEDGEATLLAVAVTPGANPPSTGIQVSADLTAIGGAAAQAFLDDGSQGDVSAGDGVFSFRAVVSGAVPGTLSLPVTLTDAEGRTAGASIALGVRGAMPRVVISQVYTGGGGPGAVFRNDFVELFNADSVAVDLAGWSVQYATGAGTSWEAAPLAGTLLPGRYYLVRLASAGGTGAQLPAADAVGTIAMAPPAGKVALVSGALPLPDGCPGDGAAVDLVGYGAEASCFEGAAPAAAPGPAAAAVRRDAGCTDAGSNAPDFSLDAPTPRNTAAAATDCAALPPPPPPLRALHEIQGAGLRSPLAGQLVRARGIVTGRTPAGFFLQAPDAESDGDPATSEAVFVFTRTPAALAVGDYVEVTGTVEEFVPSQDPHSPPKTEIVPAGTAVLSGGNPLPSPIVLAAADTNPAGGLEQLERYEGMRVRVDALTVVSPTGGSVQEPSATGGNNGLFYGVLPGVARPFREPGIPVPDPLPAGAPPAVPRFDGNPERLRVDSDLQIGAAPLAVAAGAVVTGLVGPLDFGFRTYTILPDPATPPGVSGSPAARPISAPGERQLTIASMNLQRFFDASNDPAIGEPVLTPAAFANRLHKASLIIAGLARLPDVVAVSEVENLATLRALADTINADASAGGAPDPAYVAALAEGNDPGGIDVGVLVKSSRVDVLEVRQEGKDATYENPVNGEPELLNDRPPLVLRAAVRRAGAAAWPFTVIANHLRSLNGVDDPGEGPRVRAKRRAQAEFLAALVQARQLADPGERIVVAGDLNAFAFNDGLVDVVGTIRGAPASVDEVLLASPDLVEPDLVDLDSLAPAAERYSYTFDGNAQALDHLLATQNLLGLFSSLQHVRVNADFPETLRGQPGRPERLADHDPVVAYFDLPAATATALASSANPSAFGQQVTFTAAVVSNGAPVTTGSVAFHDGGALLGTAPLDAAGRAALTTAALAPGSHTIAADYAGAGFEASRATLVQVVDPAPTRTTLASAPNPSGQGQAVTFTASVRHAAGPVGEGAVTFSADGAPLGPPQGLDAAGQASLSTAALTPGSHVITAAYAGTAGFGPSSGSLAQVVLPGITIADAVVSEGDAPARFAALFTVTLSAPSDQAVSVAFTTADGSARAGADYRARAGRLRFAPGVTRQTIAVVIAGDLLDEADEGFSVELSAPVGAAIVDGRAAGTIVDDDELPSLSIGDVTVREGNAGTVRAVFTVRLSAAAGRTVSAAFTTSDDTASAPDDYRAAAGTVSFAPGTLVQTVAVTVEGDGRYEDHETFLVVLFDPVHAKIADGLAFGTIRNDDAPPTLTVSDVRVREPLAGSSEAVFEVRLSSASDLDVRVGYRTVNGSAVAGADFVAAAGTLEFGPGETRKSVRVAVLADALAEPVQTFTLRLAAPHNATLRDGVGLGAIVDAAAPAAAVP